VLALISVFPSAVGKAQGKVSQGAGFEPGLFHYAHHFVPASCRLRFEMKQRLSSFFSNMCLRARFALRLASPLA
jgi:hypothetical protein